MYIFIPFVDGVGHHLSQVEGQERRQHAVHISFRQLIRGGGLGWHRDHQEAPHGRGL